MPQHSPLRLAWSTLALLTLACAHTAPEGNTDKAHASAQPGEDHARVHHGAMPHRFEKAEEWAPRFEDPGWDAWQKPDEVIDVRKVVFARLEN